MSGMLSLLAFAVNIPCLGFCFLYNNNVYFLIIYIKKHPSNYFILFCTSVLFNTLLNFVSKELGNIKITQEKQ